MAGSCHEELLRLYSELCLNNLQGNLDQLGNWAKATCGDWEQRNELEEGDWTCSWGILHHWQTCVCSESEPKFEVSRLTVTVLGIWVIRRDQLRELDYYGVLVSNVKSLCSLSLSYEFLLPYSHEINALQRSSEGFEPDHCPKINCDIVHFKTWLRGIRKHFGTQPRPRTWTDPLCKSEGRFQGWGPRRHLSTQWLGYCD